MSFRSLLALAAAMLGGLAAAPLHAQISINEVLADSKEVPAPDGSTSDWVELYNSAAQPVSIAGYSLTDTTATPAKWVVPANVSIPANGFLVIVLDGSRPGSTVKEPVPNAGFSLKASGDRIELYSPNGLVESWRFGPQAPDFSIGRVPAGFRGPVLCKPTPGDPNVEQPIGSQADLRINEWMANPASGKDWFEIYNPGLLPVALTGLVFSDSDNTRSPVAPLSFIGIDRAAYVRFFADNSTNDNEVAFKLGASGDSISMTTGLGAQGDFVLFREQAVGRSEGRLPDGSQTIKTQTAPTPGESNLIPYPGLVVNELLSHTDPPIEDAVEFYNQTDAPINIGGWYLSNNRNDLKKYLVPPGTVVPAKGYKVIYEYQFDREGDAKAFTFNSAHGDQVYLSQVDSNGEFTGYVVSEIFEPTVHGVSLGRYETSVAGDYKFVAMERLTFGADPVTLEQFRTGTGAPNSPPKVGPIVINELMYEPISVAADGSDNTDDEYIELRNITVETVPLYDPLNPGNHWKLQSGIDFNFPAGAAFPPLSYALVVSFDPKDSAAAIAFRNKYSVPAGVQIFGPYSGKLNNGGDAVELYKPDPPQEPPHPDAGFVPFTRVDKVNYKALAPWPTDASATGKSLQKKNSNAFGNDPINWQAAAPSAGKPNSGEVSDTDQDGLPDVWETQYGFNPNAAADAALDSDSDGLPNLGEFLAGTNPRDAGSRVILQLNTRSADTTELSFPSVPGRSYTIQYRNNLLLSSSWQKLISTNAVGGEVVVQDAGANDKNTRFYRLATPATD